MESLVYLNGDWVALSEATINVEDRGFMFADGLYEVIRYYNGKPIAMGQHVDRLQEGLDALKLKLPMPALELATLSNTLIEKNNHPDCIVYWQITRGVAHRNHSFPEPAVKPTILLISYAASAFVEDVPTPQIKAITQPDVRWKHCQIKTIQLLPNVMARQAANEAGCDESILIRDGIVTEATARSIFIVKDGKLCTYPLDGQILDSITRQVVIELAGEQGIEVVQDPFTEAVLREADEIMAVGTNTEVAGVIELDGEPVGNGKPGEVTEQLFKRYRAYVKESCGIE